MCIGTNGVCYGLGYNKYDECGIGDGILTTPSPETVDLSLDYKIIKIKAGCHHSYI